MKKLNKKYSKCKTTKWDKVGGDITLCNDLFHPATPRFAFPVCSL